MEQYISKDALVAEIKRYIKQCKGVISSAEGRQLTQSNFKGRITGCEDILSFIDTLEVINPYEEHIQYDSIKSGIQRHSETYLFNIDSKLFPQLTKEQQELWRKEIEQAVISGGEAGVELAKDIRYKENLGVKK